MNATIIIRRRREEEENLISNMDKKLFMTEHKGINKRHNLS